MLRGPHLTEAGIERGPLWGHMIAQSVAAQDDGAFADEAGAGAFLAANRDEVLAEAHRRLEEHGRGAGKRKAARR